VVFTQEVRLEGAGRGCIVLTSKAFLDTNGYVRRPSAAFAKLRVRQLVEDDTAALRFCAGIASESKIDFRAMTEILRA
jgi:hypothetical protein